MSTSRSERTRERILTAALDLFERQGYAVTTVAQVADAAGITPMTFFRHFATKDAVLVTDPYDPLIAEAVAAQPAELPPLERVRRGFLAALDGIAEAEDATARRRVALVAGDPSLRAAMIQATQESQDAIVARLTEQGTRRTVALVATAACLAGVTAALLAWAEGADDVTLADVVRGALDQLALGSPA